MAKKDLGTIIDNRWKFAKDQTDDLFNDFARYRSLFKSKITDTADYPWDYSLFNPMVFSTVRSFVSRTTSPEVGVTLQAWNEKSRPKTQTNQAILNYELNSIDLFLKMARNTFSSAVYGNGFLETGWLYKKERIVEEEDENGNVTRSIVMSPMINRADLRNIRIFDIAVANRNIPDIQEQPWITIDRWRTIGECERINKERGENIYDIKKLKNKDLFVRLVDYGKDVMNSTNTDFPMKSGLIHFVEQWDKETGRVSEIVAKKRELVVRDEEMPFYHADYPLIKTPFFPEDDEFFNTGIVRPMEDLQMGLNSVLNQYLTNARQQLNNMWMTTDIRIPDWEFISRPNGVIHVRGDLKNLREVQHKDITSQAMAMMGEMRTDIQRTTGVNDYMAMGMPEKGRKGGATSMQMEEQNLDQNLKLYMTILEQHTMTEVAKQFLKMNPQFITQEQTVTINGRKGYKNLSIKPDEVSAEFDPIVIPNSTLPKNPMVKLQNLMNVKAMADKDQKVKVNTAPIWRNILETIGETDLDEIVPEDREEALEENELLMQSIPVECEANDNHEVHIPIHNYLLVAKQLTGEQMKAVTDHINAHKLWILTQDPNLVEKLTGKQLPADQLVQKMQQTDQQNQPQQGQDMPQPNAAVNEQGLVQQQAQKTANANRGPKAQLPIRGIQNG